MPKTNYGGATAYGLQGVVEDAYGKRSELDPSVNLDGTAVDDFESDEREIEEPGKAEREALEGRPAEGGEPGVREDNPGVPHEEEPSGEDELEEESGPRREEKEEPSKADRDGAKAQADEQEKKPTARTTRNTRAAK